MLEVYIATFHHSHHHVPEPWSTFKWGHVVKLSKSKRLLVKPIPDSNFYFFIMFASQRIFIARKEILIWRYYILPWLSTRAAELGVKEVGRFARSWSRNFGTLKRRSR